MNYTLFNIKDLKSPDILEVQKKFPNQYKKNLKNLNKQQKYASFAGTFLLLKQFPAIDEDDLFFNQKGKPYLKNGDFFNISHSGDFVLFATSKTEIGVDIELMNKDRIKLSDKIFNANELEFIKLNGDNKFFLLWTLKEAYLKCLGLGLISDLPSIDTLALLNDKHFTITYKETDEFTFSIIEKNY